MQSFLRGLFFPVAGLLILASAACSRRETPAEAGVRTQTLLMGNGAEPADLDPDVISAYTDSVIAYALFEPLTWIDPKTSQAVPAAATSWDVSPDGLVYTFHLRKEAVWSNGDPVTADDFVYAYHRILSPAFAAYYSYMLWPIKNAEAFNTGKITDFSKVGAEAVDPLTLRVTLERPTPYLPAQASHNTWLPVHQATIEKFGKMDQKGTKWTRPGNLVGNGAFTLEEWIPNSRIVVVKNPKYWNAAHVRLNRIEFFPIEQAETEERQYRSGQLHATYTLPTSKIAAYRSHRPPDLRVDPTLITFYLFVNVHRPPFDNPKVRLALSHAIDREAIARDVNSGAFPPAYSLTPPNCMGYTARAKMTDDFELARKLLAEAGYPGGKGLPVTEVQSYATEISMRDLEAIQAMWAKELGFQVTIAQFEMKTLFQNQQSRNYTIAFSGWSADVPDPVTFLGTMATTSGNNWAGWSNPEYDHLLDLAANCPDNVKRYEYFQKAEAILIESAPVIPIYFQYQSYALSPDVHGWETNALDFRDLTKIWLEK
ncbi:MAG TPA: peptide ABC transporter substrate-binding protein [Opitutaceae bacterium]